MVNERILNNYYNIGGFNKPVRIGYMMKMIRGLSPLTEDEWKIWYFTNVHDEAYLDTIVREMHQSIPENYRVSVFDCKQYIYDVMFRRTFQGYNKENQALKILREVVSPLIQEAPKEWDTDYFIDFFAIGQNNNLVGIQLKPETFYFGHYQYIVDIKGKMRAFCQQQNATAFVLKYKSTSGNDIIEFSNPEVINEIKKQLY